MRTKDEEKSKAIFHATIQLLNEIGFAEISMSKIAKRAGVSPSTIYVYFDNKVDMINKLYLNIKANLSRALMNGITQGDPTKDMFKKIMSNMLEYALDNKDDFLFLEQFANSPMVLNVSYQECLCLFKPLLKYIELGIEQKLIKNVYPNLIMIYCYTPVVQLLKEHFIGSIELNQQTFEQFVEMSWDAIKA